ncbi:extracellular solute-binding protein [Paenibacillus dendritiformis]|uniref:extracellular solute-binding protein n=1 Tax=Paenibacillus dendritiformis TaxID=130049 RepID=UPI00143D8227|nr:extracellular solute-binding protein [Paenibacillus dendritiformis]NKI20772.1 extracellular solute-binding protein [Paenibacillus dendritiformis]NRF96750.1 extracellular solute-binding protein [Paenibacillus dendritiformis]
MPQFKKTLVTIMMVFVSLLLLFQFSGSVPQQAEQDASPETVVKPSPDSAGPKPMKQLKVAVQLPPMSFIQLRRLNQMFMDETGIFVELENSSAEQAEEEWPKAMQMEQSADILLLDSESVIPYARKGWILPLDPSMSGGDAVPAWLSDRVRWNGYAWGMPVQLDPYVLVWNKNIVKSASGLPSDWSGWKRLFDENAPGMAGEAEEAPDNLPSSGIIPPPVISPEAGKRLPQQWFAWHAEDHRALLSLFWRLGLLHPEFAAAPRGPEWAGRQADGAEASEVRWKQTLSELEPYRGHFQPWTAESSHMDTWEKLKAGEIAFAIVPYSEAALEASAPLAIEPAGEASPPAGQWVTSRSYVLASHTEGEQEAMRWIAYMTQWSVQQEWFETLSVLPVHEQAYLSTSGERLLPEPFRPKQEGKRHVYRAAEGLEQWSGAASSWMAGKLAAKQLDLEWARLINIESEHRTTINRQ